METEERGQLMKSVEAAFLLLLQADRTLTPNSMGRPSLTGVYICQLMSFTFENGVFTCRNNSNTC
jgi:hypothetical protein